MKDAKEYAESIGAVVVETSAKNAINIEELFQGISKYLIVVRGLKSWCMKELFLCVNLSNAADWTSPALLTAGAHCASLVP